MLLNNIEKFLNKQIEDWNENDIQTLLEELKKENKDLQDSLKDRKVLAEVIERCKNETVVKQFKVLLLSVEHYEAMMSADKMIEQFNNGLKTKEDFLKEIEDSMKSKDVFVRFTSYLIAISMFFDYDLKQHEEIIKRDVGLFKALICSLNAYTEYTLMTDLFDEFFAFRNYYYQRYTEDVMDDSDGKLKEALQSYNNVTEAVNHIITSEDFKDKFEDMKGENQNG